MWPCCCGQMLERARPLQVPAPGKWPQPISAERSPLLEAGGRIRKEEPFPLIIAYCFCLFLCLSFHPESPHPTCRATGPGASLGSVFPGGAGPRVTPLRLCSWLSLRLNLRELGPWASHMRWLVWIMASVGTIYVFFFHER